MKNKLLFFLVITLIVFSCKGPSGDDGEDGGQDKQIRIGFPLYFIVLDARDTTYKVLPDWTHIIKFNKDYYTGVDSIIFAVHIESQSPSNYCYVDLFNLTDSVIIQHSELKTNLTPRVWLETSNLIEYFPTHEINLAIRMKVKTQNVIGTIDNAYLFLYRK